MNCSNLDVKAWLLGEVDGREQAAYETHVAGCAGCREEVDRLRLVHTALAALPEEEAPRRIAFVSDKVFEPRWWQAIWRSGPAMAFASSALLACAILVHAFTSSAVISPRGTPAAQSAQIDNASLERRIQDEVSRRVHGEMAQVVAEVERRQQANDAKLLASAEQRYQARRSADLVAAQQTINLIQNQMGRMMVAANYSGAQK